MTSKLISCVKHKAVDIITTTGIEKIFRISEISGITVRGCQVFLILKGQSPDDGFIDCLPTEIAAHEAAIQILKAIETYEAEQCLSQ
jgi:hypothetical protein